ncbi:MAG: LCP family protein [Rhizonema sp. NSF051]|nr:LCP family protein [Rhizonema sp. NSF051]
MVKQVARSKDSQGKFEKAQRLPNQVMPQPTNETRNSVESTSSIPSQLYHRLGLTMPRWLFWILTVFVGMTLTGLLISSLALWTPLWSDIDRTDEDLGTGAKDTQKTPLPGDLWSNISQYRLTRPMNILVLGIAPVPGSVDGSPESFAGHSATMLLVRFNPSNKSIRVLSIPQDTMTAIPEKGLNKVSDANVQGGQVLAARVVSRTLNNAPIDRYIRITTSGLRQLVDQLGGVEVFVPQPMVHKDDAKGLSVNLVKGWQTLNGEQAEEFTRYRDPGMGDLLRVQRQQALLIGLRDRLSSPTVITKLPQIVRMTRKYFDTNLKLEEIMALVNLSLNAGEDNMQMTLLPGTFSRFSLDPNSYWLNLTGQTGLLNDYAGVTMAGLKPDARSLPTLRIAIQNASGQPQQTQKVINYLKQKGFTQVYEVSAWPDPQKETQIIVQKGNQQTGLGLQQVLGLGHIQVSATGDLESDLTIQVGKDWNK